MRFPLFLGLALVWPLSLAAQTPPDASPTTPVETVALAAFEPTREEAVLEAFVDGVVAAHMRDYKTPGVTVSVVKDGRVLFAKGYGYADAETKTPANGQETLFRIGSISKTFTWTAVMMLAERGLVNLDADINQYLKGMQIPEAFGAPVTLNHLMAHRAGFEDSFGVYTHNDSEGLSLTEMLIADMPKRVFPPGARTSYSNWGSALAAKIVEDVSGQPFNDFIQAEIFNPLAMTKTTLEGPSLMPARLRKGLSTGHKKEAGRFVAGEYMEIGAYAPAGAIASTAGDMAQWMLALLGRGEHNGVSLMSQQTHDMMWRRAFNDRPYGADLAHGFFTKDYKGHLVFGHGGGTAAFYSYMALAPSLGVGVFVSQNATVDRALVGQLPDLIIERLASPTPPLRQTSAVGSATETASDYAGAYLGNRRSFTQFEKLFGLVDFGVVTTDKDGGVVVSAQGEATYFQPVAGAVDTFEDKYGNRIVFGRDEKGTVTHYTGRFGVHSADKIGLFNNPKTLFMALGASFLFSITTWAGAWRRQGRPVAQAQTGGILNIFYLAAALVFFTFAGAFFTVVMQMSTASVSEFSAYPFPAIHVLRLFSYGVFAFAALAVFSLAPVWIGSGWGTGRKLHHTGFALALASLAVMLVVWKVIFSTTA